MLWIENLCTPCPNTQCDAFWGWGLWEVEGDEVMRAGPWPGGIRALRRGDIRQLAFLPPPPPLVWACTAKEVLWARGEQGVFCKPGREPSPESDLVSPLILDFQPPELWENKNSLFKPPSVWYFVIAARAKTEKHRWELLIVKSCIKEDFLKEVELEFQDESGPREEDVGRFAKRQLFLNQEVGPQETQNLSAPWFLIPQPSKWWRITIRCF